MDNHGIMTGTKYANAPAMLATSEGVTQEVLAPMRKHFTLSLNTSEETNRFWSKVDRSGSCWEWTSLCHKTGYGRFKLRGRMAVAHRIAYVNTVGEIDEGMELHHLCGNRRCVNPRHLQPLSKSAHAKIGPLAQDESEKDCCPQGHPYSSENTYVWRGSRFCRECRRRSKRQAYWQKRGEPR